MAFPGRGEQRSGEEVWQKCTATTKGCLNQTNESRNWGSCGMGFWVVVCLCERKRCWFVSHGLETGNVALRQVHANDNNDSELLKIKPLTFNAPVNRWSDILRFKITLHAWAFPIYRALYMMYFLFHSLSLSPFLNIQNSRFSLTSFFLLLIYKLIEILEIRFSVSALLLRECFLWCEFLEAAVWSADRKPTLVSREGVAVMTSETNPAIQTHPVILQMKQQL